MFLVLTCSFFDDPNDVDDWEVEEKIGCLFKTRKEAEKAILSSFEFLQLRSGMEPEKPIDGIFTGNCKDGDLGHWQIVHISEINTSDRVPTDLWGL